MNLKFVRMSLVFPVAAAMAAGLGLGCQRSSKGEQPSQAEESSHDAAAPARLVCYGYVDSREGPLVLQPARSGRVIGVLVKAGQTVARDTPLVQIDDRLARLQVDESEQGVKAAELQLAKAQAGVQQYHAKIVQIESAVDVARSKVLAAQDNLKATEKVVALAEGEISRARGDAELSIARRLVEDAKSLGRVERSKQAELQAVDPNLEVKLAQAQLKRSLSQQKRARQDLDEYLLKAPVAGMVLRVQIQEGDLVSPASGKAALVLVPQGSLIVRAEVSQEFADRVHPGQTVQVEDEPSGKVLGQGHMADVSDWFLPRRQFSPEPTGINTGLALECIVVMNQGHALVRIGQRVRVRVFSD